MPSRESGPSAAPPSAIRTTRAVTWHEEAESFFDFVGQRIEATEVVLDIGCGIMPMNFFRPCLHILLEPHQEYLDILAVRNAGDKSVLVFSGSAQEMLGHFTAASVDSVFLLDVIEHLEKEDGRDLLREAERIARQQVVVFTPLGFMAQHAEPEESDGWGLSGVEYQEHRSGWLPEDFGEGWDFYACAGFHRQDFRGEPLTEAHGALFAIKNISAAAPPAPAKMVNLRRPLPSEIELQRTKGILDKTQGELALAKVKLADAQRILDQPLVRLLRRVHEKLYSLKSS